MVEARKIGAFIISYFFFGGGGGSCELSGGYDLLKKCYVCSTCSEVGEGTKPIGSRKRTGESLERGCVVRSEEVYSSCV